MSASPEFALESQETNGNPVEMLVIGCPLSVADGFANALRNQGQAAHLKIAESLV